MDIVRVFEYICDGLGYNFHYGNKSNLNLIDSNSDLEPNKIHFLLFPVRRGLKDRNTGSRIYNGNFFLVMPDDFSQAYYNETEQDVTESKYQNRIEPLTTGLDSLEAKLTYCSGIDIINFDSVDAVDVLDANLSGLYITFQVRLYE